jgi:carboxyl-terminal processing protease
MRRPAFSLVLAGLITAVAAGQAPLAVETFDAAWTVVRDKHFDKTLNGVDWNAVRDELRPRANSARNTSELRAVLRDMLGRLGQSHFAIIPASSSGGAAAGGAGDPGFEVRRLGGDLLVTSVDPDGPAARAGVRMGWRVTAIEGTPVAEMMRSLPVGGNERLVNVEAWRLAEIRLRGEVGSRVNVTFEDGSARSVAAGIERRAEKGEPVTVGTLPTMFVRVEREQRPTPGGASAGIVRFNVWMAAVDAPFQKAIDEFRSASGIVIDLRGNPGGLAAMMMGIAGHFIADRRPLGVMKTRDTELRFAVNPRLVSAAGTPVQPYAGPVAILIDALSGSASECFTGGMQSLKRARVFGQTSMGQALPALFQRLPNGDVMIHAYGDFVTSDGTRLEGRGVVPDEEVPLRRDDLLAGRDRTLEAALAWIDRAARGAEPQHH